MWVLQWIIKKKQQLFKKPLCKYYKFKMALWKLE